MIKPTMPNIPGMGAMNDTLEFVKNLWGGMNVPGTGIPGMVMPTLSVEEINKQIADLRAVESWLNVNMNMLRGTIQALEVQSATISTLKSMGESFGSAVQSNTRTAVDAARAATGQAAQDARQSAASAAADAQAEQNEKRRNARNELKEEFASRAPDENSKAGEEGADQTPEEASGKTGKRSGGKTMAGPAAPAGAGNFSAPMANPALWWNMLQDQFKQAVGNAMAGEAAAPASSQGDDGSAPAAGKTAGRTAGKSAATRRKPKPDTKSL